MKKKRILEFFVFMSAFLTGLVYLNCLDTPKKKTVQKQLSTKQNQMSDKAIARLLKTEKIHLGQAKFVKKIADNAKKIGEELNKTPEGQKQIVAIADSASKGISAEAIKEIKANLVDQGLLIANTKPLVKIPKGTPHVTQIKHVNNHLVAVIKDANGKEKTIPLTSKKMRDKYIKAYQLHLQAKQIDMTMAKIINIEKKDELMFVTLEDPLGRTYKFKVEKKDQADYESAYKLQEAAKKNPKLKLLQEMLKGMMQMDSATKKSKTKRLPQ